MKSKDFARQSASFLIVLGLIGSAFLTPTIAEAQSNDGLFCILFGGCAKPPEPTPQPSIEPAQVQPPQCPNVAGAFVRPGDNLIIYWNQNGCNISSNAPSAGFDHTIRGVWTGSYFDYTVTRRNIQNGCTTLMYGRLYELNPFQLRTDIYGTDGRCDLPANFTEHSVWNKH